MTKHTVGTVRELWRYPVKSMRGERTSQLLITQRGGLGDRAWALREVTSGRIASAKKYPRLLEFRATYVIEPTLESPGRAIIETPDGQTIDVDDPDVSAYVSSIIGHPVRLECQAGDHERTGIDRTTVFGDVPVSDLKPEWKPETMPDYFELKPGSFFEMGFLARTLRKVKSQTGDRLLGASSGDEGRRFRMVAGVRAYSAGWCRSP